jgi:starvation-inducible outer membrane lipoprotein
VIEDGSEELLWEERIPLAVPVRVGGNVVNTVVFNMGIHLNIIDVDALAHPSDRDRSGRLLLYSGRRWDV